MVFDVESVGLHGEGFAVGWVVIDGAGTVQGGGRAVCPPDKAKGKAAGRKWVKENVPLPEWPEYGVDPDRGLWLDPRQVRRAFWHDWAEWKARGAVLVADCGWPVEARFLAACVDDEPASREWEGPYPLHELASFMAAAGLDPLAKRERLPEETPEHSPLADARQSARLLAEALLALTP
jgi:hypothetical protein